MRRRRPVMGMSRIHAKRFPKKIQIKMLDWDIFALDGAIQVSLRVPGQEKPVEFAMIPEDVYDLREDLGTAYDRANGI